jgi:hypothetical protein
VNQKRRGRKGASRIKRVRELGMTDDKGALVLCMERAQRGNKECQGE